MASLGEISVDITADNSRLDSAVRDSRRSLRGLSTNMRTIANRAGVMTGALAVAGAAIAANMVRQTMNAIDEQAKLARSMDATIDGLRGYTEAAEDAGVSTQEAATSAQMLNQRLGEAVRGTGQAADQLERLGLNAQDLVEMDVDERMATLADRMRGLGMSTAEMSDAMRNLGIRNREMALLMQQGGDSIRAARQEVDDFGLSISEIDARQVEMANDSMRRIGRTIEVVRTQITVALAPVINEIADRFNDAAREADGFRSQAESAAEGVLTSIGFVADAVEGVKRTFQITGRAGAVAFLGLQEGALTTADYIINYPVRAANRLLGVMDRIPGVDIDLMGLGNMGERVYDQLQLTRRATEEGLADLEELMNKPMPSRTIDEMLENIREGRREMAAEAQAGLELDPIDVMPDEGPDEARAAMDDQMAERLEAMREGLRSETEAEREAHADRLDLLREAQERGLELWKDHAEIEEELEEEHQERMRDLLLEGFRDEEELEREAHEEKMERLREALEEELITQQEFDELEEQQERKHQQRLTDILEDGESDRSDAIGRFAQANLAIRESALSSEIGALRGGLQTMFGEHKMFGEALGYLKKLEAITSAYSWGASIGGPPLGAAAAAAAGAAQAATLSDMRSASLSSSGSSQPSAGSTTAPMQGGGSGGGGQSISRSITIRGEGVSQEWIRESLVPALNEAAGDGVRFGG